MSVFLFQVPQWLPMSFLALPKRVPRVGYRGARAAGHQVVTLAANSPDYVVSVVCIYYPFSLDHGVKTFGHLWLSNHCPLRHLKPFLMCTLPTAPHLTSLPRSLFLLIGPKCTVPLAASRLFLTPITPLLSSLLPSCQFSPPFKNQSFTNSYFVKLWISVSKSNL